MSQPAPADLFGVVNRVVGLLNQLAIDYHLTGGLVSSFYGDPRFTQDIDFVIRLDATKAGALCDALASNFIVDEQVALEAVSGNDMFQALDRSTFIKIDFHVGEEIPEELSRSVAAELVSGLEVNIPAIEDAIASKLYWISPGSHKSRDDVIGMLQSDNPVDLKLLASICEAIGLQDLLQELISEAEKE